MRTPEWPYLTPFGKILAETSFIGPPAFNTGRHVPEKSSQKSHKILFSATAGIEPSFMGRLDLPFYSNFFLIFF